MSRPVSFLIILVVVLSACMPIAAQPAGPSAEEIQARILTSVALTIESYHATQAALPTATPAPTETAAPTATLAFPTFTPLATFTSAATRPPYTPPPYACVTIGKTPPDGTIFKPNKDFDIAFAIRNVGTKKWAKGADLMFDSGTNMLKRDTRYELPEVPPGGTAGPFYFDARSPKKPGTYTMTFKVQGGFCYPYIRIVVKK